MLSFGEGELAKLLAEKGLTLPGPTSTRDGNIPYSVFDGTNGGVIGRCMGIYYAKTEATAKWRYLRFEAADEPPPNKERRGHLVASHFYVGWAEVGERAKNLAIRGVIE